MNVKAKNDKNNKKLYIARDDLLTLLMNHIGDFAVDDIGWWLQTKTSNSFTVVELEFIKKAFFTLEDIAIKTIDINNSVTIFKNEWVNKLNLRNVS